MLTVALYARKQGSSRLAYRESRERFRARLNRFAGKAPHPKDASAMPKRARE
jgi:hypothetical protein